MKRFIFMLALVAGFLNSQAQSYNTPISWVGSLRTVSGEKQVRFLTRPNEWYYLTDTIKKYGAVPLTFNGGLTRNLNNVVLGGTYSGLITVGDNSSTLGSLNLTTGAASLTSGTISGRVSLFYTGLSVTDGVYHSYSSLQSIDNGLIIAINNSTADGLKVIDEKFSRGLGDNFNYAGNKTANDYVTKRMLDSVSVNAGASQIDNNLTPSTTRGASKTAIVNGLATKEPVITPGLNTQYLRGDKSFQTLDKTAVGLANVDNTSDANKPVSSAQATALGLKADKTITVNGQPLSANVVLTKSDIGLANVDNTSDASKPVSSAQAASIATKQDLLVSGTNIVTINGNNLLAGGNLVISGGGASLANPTATAGFAAVNGVATTAMRSDAAPAIDTTGTGVRTAANSLSLAALQTRFNNYVLNTRTVAGFTLNANVTLASLTALNTTLTLSAAYNGSAARTIGLNLANANTWTGAITSNAKLTVNAQTDLAGARTQIGFVGNAGSIAGQSGNQFPIVFPASLYIASANAFRYSGIMTTASASVAGSYQTTLYVNSTADNTNTGGATAITIAQDGKVEVPLAPSSAQSVVRLQDLQSANSVITLSKSANYTIVSGDFGNSEHLIIFVNATSGGVTITLPSLAISSTKQITVFKTDASANVVTLSGAANINSAATYTLPSVNNSVDIYSNGTIYYAK